MNHESDSKQDIGEKIERPANIFWAFLLERTTLGHAVDSIIDVAQVCALEGYTRISIPYQRTDMGRNRIAKSFLEVSKNKNDVIVMLDGDHAHPADIVSRLANYPGEVGVIGALYFRRGPPYDPLFFVRHEGVLRAMADWEPGMVYIGQAIATGAIAIKRWVFEQLDAVGHGYPYFQYAYPPEGDFSMTEDIFFAESCEDAGIPHHVDTGIITPHLAITAITDEDWKEYLEKHPEFRVEREKE